MRSPVSRSGQLTSGCGTHNMLLHDLLTKFLHASSPCRSLPTPQEDNFVATMTVNETMSFYADIILPKTFDKFDRKARVAEVLSAMGLKHKAKTMVGGTLPGGLMLRGLSGGERKRLSIAAGILAAPSIVFLDEPTSGLDSFAALTVMGHLKRMARDNGHVVIASIHQPRSAIWSMFDRVSKGHTVWVVVVCVRVGVAGMPSLRCTVLAQVCCTACTCVSLPCWQWSDPYHLLSRLITCANQTAQHSHLNTANPPQPVTHSLCLPFLCPFLHSSPPLLPHRSPCLPVVA